MKTDEFVTQWIIDTVKAKYADDIALVVAHNTLRIDEGGAPVIGYYVPLTKRGEGFARTFILEGTGCDIWCIPWERMEEFAELNEYNLTMLADGELLYARDSGWARRFEQLKTRQLNNLRDPMISRTRALSSYAQAKSLFAEMLFADASDVRMLAGYTFDFLSRSIAFLNHMYFRHSQTAQLEELGCLASPDGIPEGFRELYESIFTESGAEELVGICRRAVALVHDFLEKHSPEEPREKPDPQALADWYAELSYTWLRIRSYARRGDREKVFMWGICLQTELNDVCADYGLEKPRLMEYYDPDDLAAFAARADELEDMIRGAITAGGGVIHEYSSEKEFLDENA